MQKIMVALLLAAMISVTVALHCYSSIHADSGRYLGDVDMDCRDAKYCVKKDDPDNIYNVVRFCNNANKSYNLVDIEPCTKDGSNETAKIYCCSTDLCNTASNTKVFSIVSAMILMFKMLF